MVAWLCYDTFIGWLRKLRQAPSVQERESGINTTGNVPDCERGEMGSSGNVDPSTVRPPHQGPTQPFANFRAYRLRGLAGQIYRRCSRRDTHHVNLPRPTSPRPPSRHASAVDKSAPWETDFHAPESSIARTQPVCTQQVRVPFATGRTLAPWRMC